MNNISRRYYLQNKSTLLIPFFFVTLAALIFLQQFELMSIKNMVQHYAITDILIVLATGIYAFLMSIIIFIFSVLRKVATKKAITKRIPAPFIIDSVISNDGANINSDFLSRKEQQDALKNFFMHASKDSPFAFLVGKSGSGKSLLIKKYKNDSADTQIFSISDYNNNDALDAALRNISGECKSTSTRKRIIVFDQFGWVMQKKEAFELIVDFMLTIKCATLLVVFVCTEKSYAEIIKNFKIEVKRRQGKEKNGDAFFKYETYFLSLNNTERESVKNQLVNLLCLNKKNDKRYEFFCKLLCAPSSRYEDLLMIEINIAKAYFCSLTRSAEIFKKTLEDNKCLNISDDDQFEKARDLINKEYFGGVFEALEDPELANIMLYAICKYPDGLALSDFKNISFAPEKTICDTLDFLRNQKIIQRRTGGLIDSPHTMTHDYLTDHLEIYCGKRISERIAMNINLYCNGKIKNKNTQVEVSSYYNGYYNEGKDKIGKVVVSRIITGCMIALCAIILALAVMHEIDGHSSVRLIMSQEYEWNHSIHALTILALGSAIFYIYHYFQYFARIFFSRKGLESVVCVLLLLWGMGAVVLSLIVYQFWAILLAIEWMLIALLHYVLSKKKILSDKARARLKAESMVYIFTSLVLLGMNIFILFSGDSLRVWFVMFFFFVGSAIYRHINTEWMLAKLGCFAD